MGTPPGTAPETVPETVPETMPGGTIHIMASEAVAARMAAEPGVAWLPAWDCLPYDRAPPSPQVMGLRMAVLGAFAQHHPPRRLVLSIDAALQRLPPPGRHKSLHLHAGARLHRHAVADGLRRLGYRFEEIADAPGQAALRGEVIDIMPADQPLGIRVEHLDGHVAAIRRYDPQTQLGVPDAADAAAAVVIGPVSELILAPDQVLPEGPAPEHRLPEFVPGLVSVFDLLPDARILCDAGLDALRAARLADIHDAYRARLRFGDGAVPLPPEALYLTEAEWQHVVRSRDVTTAETAEAPDEPPPPRAAPKLAETGLRIGDAVVHLDHGLAALRGIETVEAGGIPVDCLRLEYAGGARLLVEVTELDRLWRYGADADSVALDHLNGETWPRRRAAVEADIARTAAALAEEMRARDGQAAPVIKPDRARLARIAARFRYTETADQRDAIHAVLADLRAGKPMDRLICGDVGFGKTEIAIRAAAAAVFAGYQVAVAAPTTVLARQHLQNFTRRFAGTGVAIHALSRLSSAEEARAAKAAMRDGAAGIVIGTHALAARGLRFARPGLVVIDEEQRFGAKQKAALRALAAGTHVLTMTATPIPRTLQAALVGLQSLSVIATPPCRRLPSRVAVLPFDPVVVQGAIERERRRGGQSFVVAPRIEDLPGLRAQLQTLLPDLTLLEAHGGLAAEAMDQAMLRFADGEADVLLSTNIVETGLDVPRANTMIIWRPDKFGLAQLHQLRGRVGRGGERGAVYLLTDPAHPPGPATGKRLQTLAEHTELGAGFAISARDLDLRGAGDLLGESQAGHVKLIGLDLYQSLLGRALQQARGAAAGADPVPDLMPDFVPEIVLGLPAYLPESYMPNEGVRVEFHTRLGRLLRAGDASAIAALPAEIADRFGPPPEPVEQLLAAARLGVACRQLGIARLEAGPQAVAATLHSQHTRRMNPARLPAGVERRQDRLVLARPGASAAARLRNAEALVALLQDAAPTPNRNTDRNTD